MDFNKPMPNPHIIINLIPNEEERAFLDKIALENDVSLAFIINKIVKAYIALELDEEVENALQAMIN